MEDEIRMAESTYTAWDKELLNLQRVQNQPRMLQLRGWGSTAMVWESRDEDDYPYRQGYFLTE